MSVRNIRGLPPVDAPSDRIVLGLEQETGSTVSGDPYRPVLVIGPQRSRKTTSIVIPSLLEWGGPVVTTSVRTDVLWATISHREKLGRVYVYEPTGKLIKGAAVTGWNPLLECDDWDEAIRIAHYLTQAGELTLVDGGFWYGLAGQLLSPMLYAAGANGYGMADLMRWINTQEEYEVRALLAATNNERALEVFEGIVTLEARAKSSVYATLMATLRVYNRSAVLKSTESSFRVSDLFDGEPNTLYLCSPPDDQEELAPLFSALLRRIEFEAYRREAQAKGAARLLMLLDEAGNIAPLANLATLASTGAGTGLQLVSVFHDVAQIVSIYGESKARTIVNNHSAWLVLPGNRDPLTNKLLIDVLGDEEVVGFTVDGVTPNTRKIPPGHAVLVYEGEPAQLLTLRSSTHDENLSGLTKGPASSAQPTLGVAGDIEDGQAIRRRH